MNKSPHASSYRRGQRIISLLGLVGIKSRFQRQVFFLKISIFRLKLSNMSLKLDNYYFRFSYWRRHGVPLSICFANDVNEIFDYLDSRCF
jgi:hypothetical protein